MLSRHHGGRPLTDTVDPLLGELPHHYTILIAGPAGVGKFEWLAARSRDFLARGERVIFVTLDLHPREARDRLRSMGLDLSQHEGTSFLFVDCYSASASEKVEEVPGRKLYTVSSYSNLEGLGMAISKAAVDLKPPVRIVFYTVSTLFLHNSPQAIAKFFQIVTNRVKTNLGFIAYAVHEGVHDDLTMNLLRSLVDGVIEMRFSEGMERQLRAHHMRGLSVKPEWRPLHLEVPA